jgi:hypothetical protein
VLSQALRDIHRCERLAAFRIHDTRPSADGPRQLRQIVAERLFDTPAFFTRLGLDSYTREANPSFPAGIIPMVLDGIVYLSQDTCVLFHIFFSRHVSHFGFIKAAVETQLLAKSGITVTSQIALVLRHDYVREHHLDIDQQFSIQDISSDVSRIYGPANIARKWLLAPQIPEPKLAPRCFLPAACPYQKKCFGKYQIGTIFDLHGLPEAEKRRRFSQGKQALTDINADGLSNLQTRQVGWQTDDYYHNDEALKAYIKQFEYPITFLDFEAVQSPIALYTDTKAFQLTPFLFSAHIRDTPDSEPRHATYICPPGQDPHYAFAQALLSRIPERGSIFVYDPGYEKIALKFLAKRFPALEEALQNTIDRMIDLSEPFRKQWVYHKNMQGRSGFKHILPAMVKDMDYTDLLIDNGEQAATTYAMLVNYRQHKGDQHPESDHYLQDLVDYCARDTWGLYQVFQTILRLSHSS